MGKIFVTGMSTQQEKHVAASMVTDRHIGVIKACLTCQRMCAAKTHIYYMGSRDRPSTKNAE